MRLTCPNCGAQYEVPDDVIPENGRDVQCSNCGDTWFQPHPDHAASPPATDDSATDHEDPDVAVAPQPSDDAGPDEDDAQGDDARDDDAHDEGQHEDRASDSNKTDPAPVEPARRELDPAIAGVLREEAAREARARKGEGEALETQPDLGLDDADHKQRDREARDRMARLRGQDDVAPDGSQQIDPGSRRDLLPDIEEINSSLRSERDDAEPVDPSGGYAEAPPPGPSGFRRGFRWAVVIVVLLLALYLLAPMISRNVPALAAVLSDYVDVIDGWRVWLDQQVAALMLWLDGMTGGQPAETGG